MNDNGMTSGLYRYFDRRNRRSTENEDKYIPQTFINYYRKKY